MTAILTQVYRENNNKKQYKMVPLVIPKLIRLIA